MAIQTARKTGWRDNYFLKAFLLGLGLSFTIFLPFILVDGGRFLFYGDFNVQQVPFYRLAHDAIRSGSWGWNSRTDLGANFIGSYSFYLLGSPFFWLTILFPSEWVQYFMGPLLILKFACATLTGYIYIHRYTKSGDSALIGAVLYAFSGFSVYNVFFNHFHEAIVCFPLLLSALDEYMYRRRRGVFALAVFACCLVNYYFFVGMVTFTLIYFFLRLICGSWRISVRDFLLLALEAVLGVALSGVLLVPSVLAVIQNNRVSNPINGWNAVLYNRNQRYMHIIECFFFPPDLPARPNFTPDSESKWSSLGAWLPLFGMTGVIGWLQLRRKHWLKKMLWVLFTMALVPFLNASFQLMNSAYYARWFYMLTLMMSLATVLALENERVNWRRAVVWNFTIVTAIAGVIGFMPAKENVDGVESWSWGLMDYPTRFWSYVAVSLICLGLVVYLFMFCKSRKAFKRGAFGCLSVVTVLYSIYFISLGKTQSDYTWDHLIPYQLNGGVNVPLTDLQVCRSDFYESIDNAAMFWQIPSIQAFHSIVPGSVMEFYDSIGVQRDVGSRPKVSHYGIRGLLSVHWLFDDDSDGEYFAGREMDETSMPGWAYYGNANGYDIWENEFYVPMGFTYEYYLPRSEYEEMSKGSDTAVGHRELSMLRALVVEDEDVPKVEGLLELLPEEMRHFSERGYMDDCLERAAGACKDFGYSSSGFSAEIDTRGDEMVFFSVPYEPGWSARVNGQEAEILKVNVGFMAVAVPGGESVRIDFTYETPGLALGLALSILALMGIIAYFSILKRMPERGGPKYPKLMRSGNVPGWAKKNGVAAQRPIRLRRKPKRAPALPPRAPARPVRPEPPKEQEEKREQAPKRLQPRPWPQFDGPEHGEAPETEQKEDNEE